MEDKILIVRNRKCRKSDVIVKFLKNENIPHTIMYLDDNEKARAIAKKYNLQASPGIIINGQAVNPYHLIEHCKVKDPVNTKKMFYQLLKQAETD